MLKKLISKKNLFFFAFFFFVATSISWSLNSYNLSNGATNQIVVEHDVCRKLSNSSGKAIFVPTRTGPEWQAFRDNATITGLTKTVCDHEPDTINLYTLDGDGPVEVSSTVTFTGIDVPINIYVHGYEEVQGYTLGTLSYSLNGAPEVDFAVEDTDGTTQDVGGDIIINSGDTLTLYFRNFDSYGGSMDINVYRTTGGTEEIAVLNMRAENS